MPLSQNLLRAAAALPIVVGGVAFAQVGTPIKPAPNVIKILPGATEPVDVTIAVNGQGTVRWGPSLCAPTTTQPSALCNRKLPKGQSVAFIAEPRAGMQFNGWAGACAGQGPRCFLTPQSKISLAATFAPAQAKQMVSITVDIPQPGGKVGPETFANAPVNCSHTLAGYKGGTCKIEVPLGTQVALKATPEAGAVFKGWSGTYGCSGASCTFTAKDAVLLSATFEKTGGGSATPTKTATLTLIYTRGLISGLWIKPSPPVTFTCSPDKAPAGAVGNTTWVVTCKAPVPIDTKVMMTGEWIVAALGSGSVTKTKGSDFKGDCGIYTDTGCLVAMTGDKTVLASRN